ncbi:tight junction protein ZO-1 isoform X3 [Drosophila obscura]|uniref:tight junction protein ZO-1 isoform X3 n=1 Tax=Drosophila obscura TaxID=7282 RepID=UPI001BB19AD1|nr:tight junction protein ZO-1 isoform X3 [Drosophila obscura]
MSQFDYTCYTVPECSTDDDDDGHDDAGGSNETLGHKDHSDCTQESDATTTTSSLERRHIYRNQYRSSRSYGPQRTSMPVLRSSQSREMTPQLGMYHEGPETPPQWGYFVPLSPNCFFSPPMQRRRYREKENDRNRRAVSYGGGDTPSSIQSATIPRAAPRRVALMKEPPPPPPPKPQLSSKTSLQSTDSSTTCLANSKYPQSEYNLIQKIDSNSTLTAPAQYQPQNFYANTGTISSTNGYGSLLCHASSTASPLAVRKRDKLLHRFSDAATLGRKLKKKKNTNRTCRSMTEAIEMLADPVIEDEFFGDRTTWEYHTVSVTRVPGYGFGIAVSGGRDNPHFANGDPSIAVSDVLKGGPAEDRLQVNDRIISVNGVSLENVEYATAVQVLRDSGNTVTLVVKRRVPLNTINTGLPGGVQHQHQHSHSLSSVGQLVANGNGGVVLPGGGQPSGAVMSSLSQPNSLNSSLVQNASGGQPIKVTLTKGNKKDDYGVVLGCRLFVKEISSKAREQLNANGYSLQEGDIITRIHNTNCGDTMSLKEAKKIIDGCKERLNLVVLRDITNQAAVSQMNLNNSGHHQQTSGNIYASHQAQVSGCSNNLEDAYLPGGASYSSQNLYVQPPTRTSNGPSLNGNGVLNEEKSNLTPRGRSRGPLMDGVSLQQLDRPVSPTNGGRGRSGVEEPPRPPPPRGTSGGAAQEDFYSSRRQLYEERQSAEPRFISFQKEGSVGIRLTGGNEAGIFVTAVQPGSPASLQGLMPGDKILKVNDMDMNGVTREEAVLFLLSLQDRIDLIVQYCKEEYDEVVTNQRGDSFHIKTHFHCDNPSKGEMAFKAGDVFRVIDTLHNGVVGSWQVLKIGRGHQEMQRGVIPNKSRAEELATAQFNATKKEMNANESRGNFFRRRRSTHRRSKSLSRENWDDVVFSDSISKFPAYERVVLRHPGFVRPVVLFGPVSDLARERLAKDFPDKFSTPLQDDDKSATSGKCRIVRLSNIRDVMDRGKHALLDITPNAVDRLNYAQFYPVVIFLKTDSKHVIKQLRHGLPKAAHKSSKKLLEQCQKLERVWSHIFSTQIVLNDEEAWYRKLRDSIDLQQSGAVWMSESKPVESLSDDFLFPMTTSRLSYASSPESDLELSPGPSASLSLGNLPQLVKASSDPSIATNQDNLDRDRDIIGEGLPPPYTVPYDHGVPGNPANRRQTVDASKYAIYGTSVPQQQQPGGDPATARPQSLYGINAPDLPPRIDRQSKPGDLPLNTSGSSSRNGSSGGTLGRSAQERLFGKPVVQDDVQAEYITRNALVGSGSTADTIERQQQLQQQQQQHQASLERQARMNAAMGSPAQLKANGGGASTYDSVSSYDSYNNTQMAMQNLGRLGPNAPDDLKSVPNASVRPLPPVGQSHDYGRTPHDHRSFGGANDLNRQSSPGRPHYHEMNASRNIDPRNGTPQRPSNLGLESSPRKPLVETKTDYGKYSRNNSVSQADYSKLPKNVPPPQHGGVVVPPPTVSNGQTPGAQINGSGTPSSNGSGPFKPVPPPKPKNYRPPVQSGGSSGSGGTTPWENGDSGSPRSPNGFYYPPTPSHHHYGQQATPGSPSNGHMQQQQQQQQQQQAQQQPTYGGSNGNYGQAPPPQPYPPANGYNGNSHHYNGGSGTGPYIAPHRGMPPPIGNLPPHTPERHALDLAGSREQRGSAFELYRKPQIGATAGHHHNMSEMEPYDERYDDYYAMPPPAPHPQVVGGHSMQRSRSAPRYPHERPPHAQDPNYYSHYGTSRGHSQPRHQQQQQQQQQYPPPQQYYDDHGMELAMAPPPLPPHKKKKSVLKSPLAALKNALLKTTRPLRRMNSMVEPERKPKGLRRQQSMLERGVQRPYYPDEFPTYPAGFEEHARRGMMPPHQDPYYAGHYPPHQQQQQEMMNSTYQNLESEDIYGNIGGTAQRLPHPQDNGYGYDQYDLYANRACIDLERRQAEAAAAAAAGGRSGGRRIVRRHSTTTADRGGSQPPNRRPMVSPGYEQSPQDIYQTRQGAYMMPDQRRAPNSEVMTRRRFYPGAANEQTEEEPLYQSRREMQREMQRNHLYQSKREMQERISQGKRDMEREFSPQSSSQSERDDRSERSNSESIYQSRREAKESALKTRTQLRDQIYQTRREALDSMAEPIYVSKRDAGRPAPIYESREESILQSRENETDEKKEGKTEQVQVEINAQPEEPTEDSTLSRSDLQKSSDTVIENPAARAPLVEDEIEEHDQDEEDEKEASGVEAEAEVEAESSAEATEEATAIENNQHNEGMLANETQNVSDDVFEAADTVSALAPPPAPSHPSTPRSGRAPFHISNILKRTAPPPCSPLRDSCTSIETQYTSQASLPVGPPNATSTPFSSSMSLPIAGPVPTSAPAAATSTNGPFPSMPREPSTMRGFFDSNGGTLADKVWHVSLQIPPGAIPAGVRQEIYFTVSDPRMGQAVGGPPLDMENGETMLSPLVMCGPQGLEFMVPVTLNIPHCAGRTASLGLALKATDSEKNLHTEWDNIDLPSNAAAHTVSVKVDHF